MPSFSFIYFNFVQSFFVQNTTQYSGHTVTQYVKKKLHLIICHICLCASVTKLLRFGGSLLYCNCY